MGWLKNVLCSVKWILGYDDEIVEKKSIAATPFVTHKPSTQYVDEDGDVAEEFYEEVISSHGYPWMKRITERLCWQGLVALEFPRLHYDFPIVIYHN
ncbi:tumor suppressor candidate 2 isoform X3 [Hydra vulgaris]|uniref:Tumor suppressor candidate 2 isoform X3 n=1 Tax=Hydra vulgaris TaxID=6087 RepID=A0ABM4D3L8_HYDVU